MAVQVFASKQSAYNKPDPKLAADQRLFIERKLKAWGKENFFFWYFWVLDARNRDPKKTLKGAWNKRLVPFRLNEIQKDLANKRGNRNLIVKPRQVGLTTYELIELYLTSVIEPGSTGMLVSQTKGYGITHFRILHRAHKFFFCANPFNEEDPNNLFWKQLHKNLLHTQYSARHELVFDMLDSRVIVDTSENEEVGQGFSINHLVCTEYARWKHVPEETFSNVKAAVPKDGTIDIESTPNGLGGSFYEMFMKAMNDPSYEFRQFFYEWWWEKEYREDIKEKWLKLSELTEEEKEVKERANLDLGQITWRRNMISFSKKEFKEKYPEDALSCFISSGHKFFDEELVIARHRELQNFTPFTTGRDGEVVIFKRRVKGRIYIIGADVARGIEVTSEDTDYSAAKVIDQETGEEMARFYGRLPPEEFGILLAELGHIYNDSVVAVERNGDGYTVLLTLNQESYLNIYRHRTWEDRFKKTVIEIPGWPNTMVNRPIAVNRLAQFLREAPELIYDQILLKEMLTFTKDGKNGRPQAMEGQHDDMVFASSIAQYVRLVNLGFIDPLGEHRERYDGGSGFQAA